MSTIDITTTSGSTTLLSKTTTQIEASYMTTDALYCASGEQTFFATVVKNATIGTVTAKIQLSSDGTNFIDVVSTKSDVGTLAVEHVTAVAGAATYRFAYVCTLARRAKAMRFAIKADVQGGAGESITVTGVAW